MAKDDYFKIVYVILTELYETKKAGERVDKAAISAERFGINASYWLDILCELSEKGYIRGFGCLNTKTGRVLLPIEDMTITMDGIEFLQENSVMKKVINTLKNIKDIAPGL